MSNATNLSFTCVNDLLQEAKINFRGRKPPNVYRTLPALREKSDLAKKQGDDETAYIMLKKWLNSVEWLRTRVKDGKVVNFYAPNMTVDQINEVKNILADMEQKLEVRYELKQNNIVEKMEVETDVATDEDEMDVPNSEIGLKLPEIPTEEKINIENEILETFECPDLLVVYSNVKEDRIRKNKLNNKNIDVEMDQHGGNKSAISRHIKSNSNDTVSPNNFVTKRELIDDKRSSQGDSVNGQRLEQQQQQQLPLPQEQQQQQPLPQQQQQQEQQQQQPLAQQQQQPLPQQVQQQQQQQQQQPLPQKQRFKKKKGAGKSRAAWFKRHPWTRPTRGGQSDWGGWGGRRDWGDRSDWDDRSDWGGWYSRTDWGYWGGAQ